MEQTYKDSMWRQFGASLEMLENAIGMCPEKLWDEKRKFWYHAFHALFFLDYYLTLRAEEFAPPAPFTFSEFEDRMPECTYTKDELLAYLAACREKCRRLIDGLTDESALARWTNVSQTMDYPVIELLLYNQRHVQHHAAQLNLMLREAIGDAPDWVSRARAEL